MDGPVDPYEACARWMHANGYADVIESPPKETDMKRLQEGIQAYWSARHAEMVAEIDEEWG